MSTKYQPAQLLWSSTSAREASLPTQQPYVPSSDGSGTGRSTPDSTDSGDQWFDAESELPTPPRILEVPEHNRQEEGRPGSYAVQNRRIHQSHAECDIVIYGIPEETVHLTRLRRLERDLHEAMSVIEQLDESVTSESVRHFSRLGKYNPSSSHPRPLLVCLREKSKAESILSKKSRLVSPYDITSLSQKQVIEHSENQVLATRFQRKSNRKRNRKRNIVIYGMPEIKGSSRPYRLQYEITIATILIQKIDESIPPDSIRDCFRMGKYKRYATSPRPLLVQLKRKAEAKSILSKRVKPYFIKPDMSPEEIVKDRLLMKKRWSLIQSGIEKRVIKVTKNCLYIKQQTLEPEFHCIIVDDLEFSVPWVLELIKGLNNWQILGSQLGLSKAKLDEIEMKSADSREQKEYMVESLLKDQALTWKILLQALKEMDMLAFSTGMQLRATIEVLDFEQEYREIAKKICTSLEKVPLKNLQTYAASLPISVRKCYEELTTEPSEPLSTKTNQHSEFFGFINEFSNFLNPVLLKDFIEEFGDEDTKSLMRSYCTRINDFQRETKVEAFVDNWKGKIPKGYKDIKVKLGPNWREETLASISPPKRTWLLKRVSHGCLMVAFSIPGKTNLNEETIQKFLRHHAKKVIDTGQTIFILDSAMTSGSQLDLEIGFMFERRYRMIVENFMRVLIQQKISVSKLQEHCDKLPLVVQEQCPKLLETKEMQSLYPCGIIEVLNNYSNFLNPTLIQNAINEFGDKETRQQMTEYIKKLDAFKSTTKLVQFVKDIWKGTTPEGYIELEMEMKDEWKEKTLADISPPMDSWLLKKVFFGGLIIVFSIPASTNLKEEAVHSYFQQHAKTVIKLKNRESVYIESNKENAMPDLNSKSDAGIILEEKCSERLTLPYSQEIMFRFSPVTGKGIELFDNHQRARRIDPNAYFDAGVYVVPPVPPKSTFEFEIEVVEIYGKIKKGYGSLWFGIAQCPRGSYSHYDIPHRDKKSAHTCTWHCDEMYDNLHVRSTETKKYGHKSLCDIEKEDRIGMKITLDGKVFFFYNGECQGIVVENIYQEEYDTFVYLNVHDRARAVKITKAGITFLETSSIEFEQEDHKGQDDSLERYFSFHPITKEKIMLLENDMYARRKDPSNTCYGAAVCGSQPLKGYSVFEVRIAEFANSSTSFKIGLRMLRIPENADLNQYDELSYNMYGSHHCIWDVGTSKLYVFNTNAHEPIETKLYGFNFGEVQQGDLVGLRITDNGDLTFFYNGKSQGIAVRDLYNQFEGQDVYPLICLEGDCYGVRITKAEIHREKVVDLKELCKKKIASCLHWTLKHVDSLPQELPLVLKDKIRCYIDSI